MARMIPASLAKVGFSTAGERKLFDILKSSLHEGCVVRYEMMVGMRDFRPDYTIIDPDCGILILEIKDWGIDHINRATKEQFWVTGYHGSTMAKVQLNPDVKCQHYLLEARSQLSAMPSLRDETGRLSIPVKYAVAFPNIKKNEFLEKKFDQLIPTDLVFLNEDLRDNGDGFRSVYSKIMPKLAQKITEKQITEIGVALFPDITLPRVTQSGFLSNSKDIVNNDIQVLQPHSLSLEQEEIAKSLGEGPRLLRGIAGTGKTLIMLYRAKLQAANNPSIRILILCWNASLANYMNQAYDRFQFEAKGHVDILNFTTFVSRKLGYRRNIDFGNDDDSWIMERINNFRVMEDDKYDAVYIDEAQDFRKEWIEAVFERLIKGDPKERNLIIAADDAQRIYTDRGPAWSSLGIPMVGRSKILKTIYRNSARVWTFSAFLLKDKASYVKEDSGRIKFSAKGGYDPQLIKCENIEAQIIKTIEIIKAVLNAGNAARNVLILYHGKVIPKIKFPLVEKLIEQLVKNQIPYNWIAQDKDAKHSFNWDDESVKISTVQSAKGMDSPIVIVLGAEHFISDHQNLEIDETRLMYVALTRAQEFLVVLYSDQGGMVEPLLKCQEEYKKYRDAIVALEAGD